MPLEVFYSYSHKDENLRYELEKHLAVLRRQGLIVDWHDRRISAGDEWRGEIDAHVRSAHIILLLISADFLASDYCYDVEMKLALDRHEKHAAIVIPIILRPVEWSGAPFAKLQAMPRGKPITLWPDRDEAIAEVAHAIREIVVRFSPSVDAPDLRSLIDENVQKSRVLDAAIPSHTAKDRATEVLVLIRLPESEGLKGILLADDEAEARPEDVRWREFGVIFPTGPTGRLEPFKVTVKLTSPDFHPAEQTKKLFVPPDADSDVCTFVLTPVIAGRLKVLVELQWEDALRGSRRLLTQCVTDAASVPANPRMNVVQMPVGLPPSFMKAAAQNRLLAEPATRAIPLDPRPAPISSPPEAEPDQGFRTWGAAPPPPALPKGVIGAAGVTVLLLFGGLSYHLMRPMSPPQSNPVIAFQATPISPAPGGTARLTWHVTGATKISIDHVGPVAPVGQADVDAGGTYKLTAEGPGGIKSQMPAPASMTPPPDANELPNTYSLALRIGKSRIAPGSTIYIYDDMALTSHPTCEIKGPAGASATIEWSKDGLPIEQRDVTLKGTSEPTQVACPALSFGKYVAKLRVNGDTIQSVPFTIEARHMEALRPASKG
jgi:hypothetical protein